MNKFLFKITSVFDYLLFLLGCFLVFVFYFYLIISGQYTYIPQQQLLTTLLLCSSSFQFHLQFHATQIIEALQSE